MKKVAVSLFILLLASSLVGATTYTLPGSTSYGYSYNNIGLLGTVSMEVNVTLLNTAPFPKFIIVNPRYDFRVNRLGGSEAMGSYLNGTQPVHILPPSLSRNTLNYRVGFWIYPYEAVVVTFIINQNYSYRIPMQDYRDACGGGDQLSELSYTNGTLTSGHILTKDDIGTMVCGVVYPELLNAPEIIYMQSLFPLRDGNIKVLEYEGVVHFNITNVPSNGEFRTFFAAAIPVIFKGANITGFTPNYTMMYSDYVKTFIWRYMGVEAPSSPQPPSVPQPSNMFQLTSTLITGPSVEPAVTRPPAEPEFDFPVWIILMGKEVEITYHISWMNEGR
ncbi:hypothetical protein [Thermococcus sp.]|uniref:hypothetical protein n=1 Tax=Thermococcus sp. TaxID=35749 RepID=UPI0026019BDA|nr:hypothetical protein [Thermococcus sp.]